MIDRPIHVLDAGCGSAYLSLAAYHYLTVKRGLSATLTGIDYNADLIAKDGQIAEFARLWAGVLHYRCNR